MSGTPAQIEAAAKNKAGRCKGATSLLLAILALILGTAPSVYCETLVFRQVENDIGHLLLVGPYSYRTKYADEWSDQTFASQTCNNYGRNGLEYDFERDSKTKTVWAFSIMTPIIGFFVIVKSFLDLTCHGLFGYGGMKGYACIGYSYLLLSIFQGITLIIDKSSLCYDNPALQYLDATNPELANTLSDECEITTGYVLQAISVALWILAAISTFALKDVEMVAEQPTLEQEVTYTQKADGTAEETNVVVKGAAVEQAKE